MAPQEVATTLTCAASQVRCWPGQGICRLFLLGALLPNLLLQAPNQVWFSVSGQSPTSFLILWERRAIKWAGGMQWRKGPEVSQATKTSFARLFPMVHAKHTAGSVVTHATSLLSSAWCDPFPAYAAGILGFAGPLQGRANQEFICMLRDLPGIHSGRSITWRVPAEEALKQSDGKMMYGFMVEFAKKHKLAEKSSLVALARHLGQELPPILQKLSGAVQPFPNPDAISGVLLQECMGIGPEEQHPAMLAQSRAIGALAAASWQRGHAPQPKRVGKPCAWFHCINETNIIHAIVLRQRSKGTVGTLPAAMLPSSSNSKRAHILLLRVRLKVSIPRQA